MPEPGYARITHPLSGGVAEVPVSSLGQHYAAGWAPLDESPEPPPKPGPKPVRAPAATKSSSKEGE
jgi:hypothetical protein